MADSRIQDLPAIDSLADGDLFPVAREGDNFNARKLTAGQMTDYIASVAQPYLTGAQEAASQASMSAASASIAVSQIGTAVEDTQAAQKAAEAARDEAMAAGAGIDEKVTRAETAAQTATEKAEQAQSAVNQIAADADAAESAKVAAQSAQAAAETAQQTAQAAATAAELDAQNASQSAKSAQTAQAGAESAQNAIENLGVAATTLEPGSQATVEKSLDGGSVKLTFGLPAGDKGDKGDPGNSVQDIRRVGGTHAPGTTDTYEVVLTDGSTGGQFSVYNGADGQGAGDMLKSVYDPQNKNTDVFAYVDQVVQDIPVPDVSAQIAQHNADGESHQDIRAELAGKETAGAASAVQSNLDTHVSNKQNPHSVTAEQTGADPKGSAAQALTDAKSYADTAINAAIGAALEASY